MRTILSRLLFATSAVLFVPLAAHAGSIGLNFGDPSFNLAPNDVAGVYPQNHWQNLPGTEGFSGITLLEDTDLDTIAPTSATLTLAAGGLLPGVQIGTAVSGPDERLNNTSLDMGAAFSLSIANVPYAQYDVIAYVFSSFHGRHYSVTVGATTLWGLATSDPASPTSPYIDNNSGTPFTYVSAVGTTLGGATPEGNYYRFTGLTGGVGTPPLVVTLGSSDHLPSITALQIINTTPAPEPGSALLLLGGAGLVAARRRRS